MAGNEYDKLFSNLPFGLEMAGGALGSGRKGSRSGSIFGIVGGR